MSDILLRIQNACFELKPSVLIVPGLLAAVLGLLLWLGGVRYSFFVVGVLGAAVGAAGGLLISQWFDLSLPLCVTLGAVLLALIAALMPQPVVILLAILIFAALAAAIYVSCSIETESWQTALINARQKAMQSVPGTIEEDAAVAKLRNIFRELRSAAGAHQMSLFFWAVVGGAIGLGIAFFLKKVIVALCCSMVGAAAIFVGMFALLLAKQAEVLTALAGRPGVFLTLFILMILFGWGIQVILASAAKTKTVENPPEKPVKENKT